jgi:hypothetical protein
MAESPSVAQPAPKPAPTPTPAPAAKGPETVSNGGDAVVTKGTTHLATTQGATDSCFNPPKTSAAPYDNHVPSTQLGAGQTTNTFIAQKPIVTKVAVIEPPSAPAHAGTGKGVASQTYCDKATPVGSSKDVKAEGNLICRSGDETKQNAANTVGSFTDPVLDEKLKAEKARQLQRCSMFKLEGECSHGKRKLDFPPNAQRSGDGYYLEILSDDVMTFKATRKNAVEPGDAVCPQHLHTAWLAVRTGGGEAKKEKKQTGSDDFIIDGDLIGIPSIDSLNAKYKTGPKLTKEQDALGQGVNPLGKDQQQAIKDARDERFQPLKNEDRTRARMAAEESTEGNKTFARQVKQINSRDANVAAFEKKEKDAQGNKNKISDQKIVDAVNVVQNLAKLALLWNALRDPVVITVNANACSGAKNSKLVVYPSGKFKFDLYSEKVSQKVQKLRAVAYIVEKMAALFGKRAQVKFLEKPQLSFTIEYKELSKDWPKKGLLKSQVNRTFEGAFSFENFISVKAEFGCPILNFFGPMGATVNFFISAIGLEGQVYVSGEIAFQIVNMSFKFDEYEEAYCSANISVKIVLEIGCKIRWKDIAEVSCSGYVETTITFPEFRTVKEHPLEAKYKGEVQLGIKGGGWGDIWGWKKSVEFNYKPPDWKYKLGDGWMCVAHPIS